MLHTQQRQEEMKKELNSDKLPKHDPAVIKCDITCTVINILNLFTTVQDLQIGIISN